MIIVYGRNAMFTCYSYMREIAFLKQHVAIEQKAVIKKRHQQVL